MDEMSDSPHWSTTAKLFVAITFILLLSGLLARFRTILPLLILAAILTFLIVPVVRLLTSRWKLSWKAAANICFVILLLILGGFSTAVGLGIAQQLTGLFIVLERFLTDLPQNLENLSQQQFTFGPWSLDLIQFELVTMAEQLLAVVQPVLAQASGMLTSIATGALEWAAGIIFVLAISYFMIVDYNLFRDAVVNLSIPHFEEDFHRLRIGLSRIWQAYVRGQLLVVAAAAVLTWMLMEVLGLRYALGLGVLGGLAKFVPIIGPWTGGIVAAVVALFMPTNWLGLTPLSYAFLVAASIVLLDQAIDYLVVPRIMGHSLNLHPVVVLIGLLIGAALAGVLGLLLSAPVMASCILLGRYIYRKMVDLDPWDPPIDILVRARAQPGAWHAFKQRLKRSASREGTQNED